jgi:hypothetical protein
MTFETDDSVMLVEFTTKTTMWTKVQRQRQLWSLKRKAASQMCKLHETQIEDEASSRKGESPANLALQSKYFPSPSGNGLSVSISFHETNFYTQMPSFKHFKDIMNDDLFQEAPTDWHVIITDIVGSTQAIKAGAYSDVNTIGAASISTVLYELGEEEFPFAFGGDGASLLIPPHWIGHILEVLMRLQKLARDNFDLELRVGHMPVKTLVDDGFKIEVAKHELCAGRCIAVFRGGGLTEAEVRIKTNTEKYCVHGPDELGSIELKNLKCRWNHIPSKRGKIMSLIVKASDVSVYTEVLEELDKIYNGKLDEANPVNLELLTHKSINQIYQDETRFHSMKTPSLFYRATEMFASVSVFKYKVDPMYFDAKHYAHSQRSHADFQKFDDMLRMVIDCSDDQAGSIISLLKTEYDKGRLTYGTHISEKAIMTCYVEDETKDGGHIHFIDGDKGGYSVAAKQMKWQTRRANRAKH